MKLFSPATIFAQYHFTYRNEYENTVFIFTNIITAGYITPTIFNYLITFGIPSKTFSF